MSSDQIVITGYARTPMGGFQGDFADVTAADLGSAAIWAAVERSSLTSNTVENVIMGCVLQAGQGQAPARQASLGAGLPQSAGCSTINKMCGSGMQAMMMAHDSLIAGSFNVIVAGGMESMTNAPYLLPKARSGMRMEHGDVKDHMFLDGLEDAYDKGKLMGVFAEQCASKYTFSREEQDAFAIESVTRAQDAMENGWFEQEITPVTFKTRKGDVTITEDEQPKKAKLDKIPKLRAAFAKDGTITAANASSISDGAAAVVMMKQSEAEKRGVTPIAKIVAHTTHAHEPEWFTTAPVSAMKELFKKTGWQASDVDLFEINEAFAVVTMAAIKELDLPADKVNIHGGACALGHPIGASGARIVCTLISALQQTGGKKGVASLCIGGGEAVALAVELA